MPHQLSLPAAIAEILAQRPLRLGTRQSPLAMAQAQESRARLCAFHGLDPAQIELVSVLASGDKVQDRPLADIGGKALWTKELDRWLADKAIDFAVHSMKDVETIRPDFLTIAAILPRADIRDVLLGADSLDALPQGARLGTSAPRRAAQALCRRPDLQIVPYRGNVATRMAKLEQGEADATLLAAAGLARLGLSDIGTPMDAADWLPAPAQGAIGIETRSDDPAMIAFLAAISHAPSEAAIRAERALLAALGGNCHSPIAALAVVDEGELHLEARLFSADGRDLVRGALRFDRDDADAPARLAADLLARAAPSIRALFDGPSA